MEGMTGYSPRRPRKGDSILGPSINPLSRGGGSLVAADPRSSSSTISKVHDRGEEWINSVPSEVLVDFPENEVNRQTTIPRRPRCHRGYFHPAILGIQSSYNKISSRRTGFLISYFDLESIAHPVELDLWVKWVERYPSVCDW
ncbi:hypothetical protein C8J55DRAFT_194189 [Lentinula edodes]|uniref:Uncharacterized protein n=1 Tax=Lentinula lateritia TaxID=40482 RepID=A0A9W8ZXR7_9AGAR|nr:hypothetical protein C8J55DRAFT_194189 [Lentinula edodes]